MAYPLRQATAGQELTLGIFVDSGDGDSEEPSLTIANTDIELHKSGATTLASKNSGGATYISNGIYYIVLDATDTDTIGGLDVYVHVSGALAVKRECVVYAAAVYDVLFGTNAPAVAGDEMDLVDAPNATAVTAIQSGIATAAALATVDSNVDSILADTGTDGVIVASIATDAVNAAALAADAVAEINATVDTALADYDGPTNAEMEARTLAAAAYFDPAVDTVAHVTLVDTTTTNADMRGTDSAATAANLATTDGKVDTISTNVDAILVDTAALNDTALPDSVPADGSIPTLKQAIYMVTQFLMERSTSGTTVTVKKVDGSTSLLTLTLDDATTPTSITRAT